MNVLVAVHLFFVALGFGGAASLYALAEEKGRDEAERVAWAGLIGALVTGPVYGLSRPELLDTVIIVKLVIALLLLGAMYRVHGELDEMEVGRRSTFLLGIMVVWLVVFFLGVEAAHP